MSIPPARYLVELRADQRPAGYYLHVWEDEVTGATGSYWSRDASRALRFADRRATERHIREHLDVDATAAPLASADAVRDCGCAAGQLCRRNGNCPRLAVHGRAAG